MKIKLKNAEARPGKAATKGGKLEVSSNAEAAERGESVAEGKLVEFP
jgi:hypothetical protein